MARSYEFTAPASDAMLPAAAVAPATVVTPATPATSVTPSSASRFDHRTILQHVARYLSATYVSRLLCILRGFINARWLGPDLYGFFGSLSFFTSFGYHLHAGAEEIMMKEVPASRSRGDVAQARRIVHVSRSFFMVMLGIGSLALMSVAFVLPGDTPWLMRLGWIVAGIVMPLEVMFSFEQHVATAEERITQLSKGVMIATLVSVLLTCWLVVAHRLAGLYVVAILTPAIGVWYLRRHAGYRCRFVWDWPMTRSMIRSGWPVLAMMLVFQAMQWVDRALVLGFVGMTGFGYYALGVVLSRMCFFFPEVVAQVVAPSVHAEYATHREGRAVGEHLWFSMKLLAILMPATLGILHLALGPAVRLLMPEYLPGLPVIRLLVWGSFFMGMAYCTKSLIVTFGRQKQVMPIYAAAVAVNAAVSGVLLWAGWGLIGVATGTVTAYLVCSSGLFLFVARHVGWSRTERMVRLGKLYGPWAGLFAMCVGVPSLAGWIHTDAVWGGLELLGAAVLAVYGSVVWKYAVFVWRNLRAQRTPAPEVAPSAGCALPDTGAL